jgi:hypothetical protein
MPAARRNRPGNAVWPCLLVLLPLAGCSVSDYDRRYEQATKAYRLDSMFLAERAALADNRVGYRVARLFGENDTDGKANWSKPSFLRDFPGFRVAYRGEVEAAGAKMPVTLAIGVLTDEQFDPEKVKRDISAALRDDAAFPKAAWEEGVETGVRSQEGRPPWSRLKLTGKQPFEFTVAGNPEQKNIEGTTEVWVNGHPDNKVLTVLVWRAPAEVIQQVKLEDLALFTAASIVMNPLAVPAPADPAAAPADAVAPAAAAPAAAN